MLSTYSEDSVTMYLVSFSSGATHNFIFFPHDATGIMAMNYWKKIPWEHKAIQRLFTAVHYFAVSQLERLNLLFPAHLSVE